MAGTLAASSGPVPANGEAPPGARLSTVPPSGFREALSALLAKLSAQLSGLPARQLPVRLTLAGGAALHLHTDARVTEDVDAVFSRRVLLEKDVEISWLDPDGRTRLLYLDRNYNDTLGLMHEDAYDDATPVMLQGVDRKVLDVRVLTPLDLAVSKLARFADQDRADIELLARRGLIRADALRKRAEQALGGYVGQLDAVRLSIDIACRVVEAATPGRPKSRSRK